MRYMVMIRRISIGIALLLSVSCGNDVSHNSADAQASLHCAGNGLVVSDAWLRKPSPGQNMSAAYLSICNGGDNDDRLISASLEGTSAVEIHRSQTGENGVAQMRRAANGIALPALSETALVHGGNHIMIFGASPDLFDDDETAITLTFETAPPVTVLFEIRDTDRSANEHNH